MQDRLLLQAVAAAQVTLKQVLQCCLPWNKDANTCSSGQASQRVFQCQVPLPSAVGKAVRPTKGFSSAACRWPLTAKSGDGAAQPPRRAATCMTKEAAWSDGPMADLYRKPLCHSTEVTRSLWALSRPAASLSSPFLSTVHDLRPDSLS